MPFVAWAMRGMPPALRLRLLVFDWQSVLLWQGNPCGNLTGFRYVVATPKHAIDAGMVCVQCKNHAGRLLAAASAGSGLQPGYPVAHRKSILTDGIYGATQSLRPSTLPAHSEILEKCSCEPYADTKRSGPCWA